MCKYKFVPSCVSIGKVGDKKKFREMSREDFQLMQAERFIKKVQYVCKRNKDVMSKIRFRGMVGHFAVGTKGEIARYEETARDLRYYGGAI